MFSPVRVTLSAILISLLPTYCIFLDGDGVADLLLPWFPPIVKLLNVVFVVMRGECCTKVLAPWFEPSPGIKLNPNAPKASRFGPLPDPVYLAMMQCFVFPLVLCQDINSP